MAVKLVVIYPRPKDVQAFEAVYKRDHVPMAVAKLAGKTKIVATRVPVRPPQGSTQRGTGTALQEVVKSWEVILSPSNGDCS